MPMIFLKPPVSDTKRVLSGPYAGRMLPRQDIPAGDDTLAAVYANTGIVDDSISGGIKKSTSIGIVLSLALFLLLLLGFRLVSRWKRAPRADTATTTQVERSDMTRPTGNLSPSPFVPPSSSCFLPHAPATSVEELKSGHSLHTLPLPPPPVLVRNPRRLSAAPSSLSSETIVEEDEDNCSDLDSCLSTYLERAAASREALEKSRAM